MSCEGVDAGKLAIFIVASWLVVMAVVLREFPSKWVGDLLLHVEAAVMVWRWFFVRWFPDLFTTVAVAVAILVLAVMIFIDLVEMAEM